MQEIMLPDNVKPALEWVGNRIRQKVSPKRKHALAQTCFAAELLDWAKEGGLGMVGTEWQFQIRPPREIARTLVPDVAFLAYTTMPFEELERTEIPSVAPDAVVEVRSPDDQPRDIEEKVRVYVAAGTRVVFVIDPQKKNATIVDPIGSKTITDGLLEHPALPGFHLELKTLFEMPRPHDGGGH